jgi:glycosyltransferase involved in cell wall biosynthesis
MKKRILFINDEMTMGGVARILNTLLQKLDNDVFDIDLLILHPHGELMNEIPNNVNVIQSTPFFRGVDVNLKQALKSFNISKIISKGIVLFYMKTGLIASKIRQERKKMGLVQYDVEFSAKEGFCTLFVAYGNAKRKLNWVQVDYSQQNYASHHMNLMISALQKIDMNIACSMEVKEAFESIFKVNQIKVIHNMVEEALIHTKANELIEVKRQEDKFQFITVARFHPQKSIDRLIVAFAKVIQMHPHCELIIIGDGQLKSELIALVEKLYLTKAVHFLGLQSNPYPYIKQADVFVMSSLYEGYPTITLESFMSGTPVISTKVSGVLEQISESINGFVVENTTEGLIQKMKWVVEKPQWIQSAKQQLKTYHYPNEEILNEITSEILGESLVNKVQ